MKSTRCRLVHRALLVATVVTGLALPAARAERPIQNSLAEARRRIERGDARGAAEVAAEVAQADPDNGRAHFVLGLALYHATDYAGALAAFREARQARHPPASAPLAMNEGAALFALGHHDEAIRAFDEAAARDAGLRALAELYAAQAAAGAERWDEARRRAARAEALPGSGELRDSLASLRAEIASREADAGASRARRLQDSARAALDQGRFATAIAQYERATAEANRARAPVRERAELAYGLGHARYQAGRLAGAARAFSLATALAPADADVQFMAALTDYRRDRLAAARHGFERSLALGLAGDTRASAEAYAEALAPGLRVLGKGWGLTVQAGGGYDSNVAQLGAVRPEAVSAEYAANRASGLASATAQLAYGLPASQRLFLRGHYLFQQVAYAERALDPFSVQLHRLRLDAEWEPLGPLRLGLAGGGELQYTGVRDRRGFLRILSAEPSLALDLGDHATTVATFALEARGALSDDAVPLAGRRWEARLAQRLRGTRTRAELAVRHAREDVGQLDYDLGQLDAFWTGRYVIPYSHRSTGVLADATTRLGPVDLGLGAAYERLQYTGDTVLRIEGAGGADAMELERARRADARFATHATLTWWLARRWALDLRYDLTINQSTIRFTFDDKNFTKHTATAGLLFRL